MSYASRASQSKSQPPKPKSYARRDPAQAPKRSMQPSRVPMQRKTQPPRKQMQPRPAVMTQQRAARPPSQGRNQQEMLAMQWEGDGNKIVKIRKISSGDTVICETRQGEVISVTLNHVQAPRIARSERAQESFFAYEAREFLRNKFVGAFGRVVNYVEWDVSNLRPNDPKPFKGNLLIAETEKFNRTTKWTDLTELVVEHGWADVKDNISSDQSKPDFKPQSYWENLRRLSAQAQGKKLGKFGPVDEQKPLAHLRRIDKPDVEEFFNAYKGKRIPAVVDEIREGSTVRCEMNLHAVQECEGFKTSLVFVHMSGIQSVPMPKPESVQRNEYESKRGTTDGFKLLTADELATRGQKATTKRLLHQDVEVRLDNCVGNRLYGTIFCGKGDIAQYLLLDGLAEVVDWHLTPDKEAVYSQAQNLAIERRKGRWGESNKERRPRKKQSLEKTKVTQVRSGDCVTIGKDVHYMASIRCPRSRNPNNDNDYDQDWHFESKEFVRSVLIGGDIEVKLEYERGINRIVKGENVAKTLRYVSIFYVDKKGVKKNISEELMKKGYAELIPHKRDDPRAYNYTTLNTLEKEAKEKKVGKWSTKKYTPPACIDYSDRRRGDNENELTQLRTRAAEFVRGLGVDVDMRSRRRIPDLEQRKCSKELRGVVEYCVQATKLKITLVDERPMKKIFIFLSGVKGYDKCEKGSPEKAISDEANDLVRELIQQKEVWVVLEGVDTWANFLGQVYTADHQNLAILLLNRGFAEVFPPSAQRSRFENQLLEAEAAAKEGKKGRWENWEEPEPEPEVIEEHTTEQGNGNRARPQARRHEFEGTTKNAVITHIDNATEFYVNLEQGQETLQEIVVHMSNVNPTTNEIPDNWSISVENRPVLAALFEGDGNYYRFRVMSVNKKNQMYRGLFIDFGNTVWVAEDQLLPLQEIMQKIPGQAHKCTLAGLRPPPESTKYFQPAGEALDSVAYNRQLKLRFIKANERRRTQSRITTFDVEATCDDESVNCSMCNMGYARINPKSVKDLEGEAEYLNGLKQAEKSAQEGNKGMYQYGVGFESDDEGDKKNRRGGGRRR